MTDKRQKSENKLKFMKIDLLLLMFVLLLVFFGSAIVYSASYYELGVDFNQESHGYLLSTLFFAVLGIISMLVMSFIDFKFHKYLVSIYILLTLALLILVLFIGEDIKGSVRTIKITSRLTIMPSEIAKACLIFSLAFFISNNKKHIKKFVFLTFLILFSLIFVGLVYLQNDFSTSVLILSLVVSLFLISGFKFKHLLIYALICISMVFFVINKKDSFRSDRMEIWQKTLTDRSYIYEDSRSQIMNSIYAISTGRTTGKGPGLGEFSNLRLSEAYADFIFSVYAEEYGFIGSVLLLLIFLFIIYRIFKIAIECDDFFGFLIAAGVGILISYQVVINVGVALAILPTTGITLPFVSKGGSSLVVNLALIGVVLNISSYNRKVENKWDW